MTAQVVLARVAKIQQKMSACGQMRKWWNWMELRSLEEMPG
jgi:hypothetical protein